jgi:hypothetical protein
MPIERNDALIQVLKNALYREEERIRQAEKEIFQLKLQLLELGVELPLED